MTAPLTLLFDLDGTLADTDALHVAACGALLSGVRAAMTGGAKP